MMDLLKPIYLFLPAKYDELTQWRLSATESINGATLRRLVMATPYIPKERTSLAIKDGFDRNPELKEVKGGEVLIVYRAHGDSPNTSSMIGRFFFTPQIDGTPRLNWTADMLERELNAALWGNDFKYLATFRVREKTSYKIGAIAHDKYQGTELDSFGKEVRFDQYSYFRNNNLFVQVEIPGIARGNWRTFLDLFDDRPIKPGRFHRRVGKC